MVLTRATLEKLGKEELISMFLEKYKKLNNIVTQLTNQLGQVVKTLKRMESQLVVSNSVNEAFQNRIISLERQCWKNEQYSRREYIEIVGIPDTADTKACELIETATGISITPDSLEACHRLPSDQNDKLIIKFSRRKDAEMVLSKLQKQKQS